MKNKSVEQLLDTLMKICSNPDYNKNYDYAASYADEYKQEILRRFKEKDKK